MIRLERLLDFVGFGDPNPRVVVVGLEEGFRPTGPDKIQALRDELILRSGYPSDIIDLRDSFKSREAACLALVSLESTTWRNMAHVMLAFGGQAHANHSREALRTYQEGSLGATTSGMLLVEVMPLPSPSLDDWLYAQIPEIAREYPTRDIYREKVWPGRGRVLRAFFARIEPKLVICHGKGRDWCDFRAFFGEASFDNQGPFRVGVRGRTRVILSPHLSRLNEIEALEALVPSTT